MEQSRGKLLVNLALKAQVCTPSPEVNLNQMECDVLYEFELINDKKIDGCK